MSFKDYREKVIRQITKRRKEILREIAIALAYYEIYRTMHEYKIGRYAGDI